MANRIYASNMSLDACTEDERGRVDWPNRMTTVFVFITDLVRPAGFRTSRHKPSRPAWSTSVFCSSGQ